MPQRNPSQNASVVAELWQDFGQVCWSWKAEASIESDLLQLQHVKLSRQASCSVAGHHRSRSGYTHNTFAITLMIAEMRKRLHGIVLVVNVNQIDSDL